jgi:segregation and condensation protein B
MNDDPESQAPGPDISRAADANPEGVVSADGHHAHPVPAEPNPTAQNPVDRCPVDRCPDDLAPGDLNRGAVNPTDLNLTDLNRGAETAAEQAPAAEEPASASPAALREPDEDVLRLAEALVFASAEPVTPRGLARVLPDDVDAEAVLTALRARYAGRGVELVDAAGGVMFRSALDLAPRLRKVIDAPRRLPRVAMETLAIVAYHQPMTRPEIEHIRGTALSQQTLDSLLELNLIAPKGRRETPGRPTLWGTTPEFLAHFGLKDLRELPRREDLLLETAPPRATPEAISADLQAPPAPGTGAG